MTVRVTTLKSGSVGRYYTEQLPSYYLDGGEPRGVWWGRGAEELGLDGGIDGEAFLAVMAGQDPETGKDLGRRFGDTSVRGRRHVLGSEVGVGAVRCRRPPASPPSDRGE